MAEPPGLSVQLITGTITENRDLCGRAGAPRRTTGSPLELLLTLLSSPIGRLQKEVRLAQKADYSAERTASPLPYDKISVRCPPPFLQGFWCLGQAYVPPRGRPPPPGSCRGPGTLQSPALTAAITLSAAWGQDAGSECPDVPLPAPKAADALHGEVSNLYLETKL